MAAGSGIASIRGAGAKYLKYCKASVYIYVLSLRENFSHRIYVYQCIIKLKTQFGVSSVDMQEIQYGIGLVNQPLSITSDLLYFSCGDYKLL